MSKNPYDSPLKPPRKPPPLRMQIEPHLLRDLNQWIGQSAERAQQAELTLKALMVRP